MNSDRIPILEDGPRHPHRIPELWAIPNRSNLVEDDPEDEKHRPAGEGPERVLGVSGDESQLIASDNADNDRKE